MIFKLVKDESCQEAEVTLKCAVIDEHIRQLAENIKNLDFTIKCKNENGYINL